MSALDGMQLSDKIRTLLAASAVRINVGCGRTKQTGYINVDVNPVANPDLVANGISIPLPDECANEVMAIHVFEHFYRWEADDVLIEWRRLLKPSGLLVLELPNLEKCCRNICKGETKGGADPNQLGLWGLYGDPRTRDPRMVHKWAWTPTTLGALLEENGFRITMQGPTLFHTSGRLQRDMRIEARKNIT